MAFSFCTYNQSLAAVCVGTQGTWGAWPDAAAAQVSVVAPPSQQSGPRTDPLLSQTENGVLLPSLQSALPFLDLHGTPRLEFHQSVFDELRDKLLERVSGIASEGKAEERWVGG